MKLALDVQEVSTQFGNALKKKKTIVDARLTVMNKRKIYKHQSKD